MQHVIKAHIKSHQWSNYLPQGAEIWIIEIFELSQLVPQWAKNTVNEQPNT